MNRRTIGAALCIACCGLASGCATAYDNAIMTDASAQVVFAYDAPRGRGPIGDVGVGPGHYELWVDGHKLTERSFEILGRPTPPEPPKTNTRIGTPI